ncbi:uncharacterized protein LOC105445595, partial [Strongylocentrotus purpuratus]|uniref:Uncharacterized protein n=1 Tax=Strongylocentrotus purpuratus TaxID=7668 RepID=A0A7M7HPJ0_STRPU
MSSQMNIMDLSSSLVLILVFIVSVDYTASQSEPDNGTEVGLVGYGESLTIVSTNYPNNYPNNINTQWLVSGPADDQIMAVFSTFDLEYNHDFLRVGSGLDPDDTASLLATLSGSSLPDIIVSNNNEMWLVFTSDGSNTELGFRVNIEVSIARNYTDLGNGTEVVTFGFGESLTIVSPNYPNNYPNNVNTQWLVSGPADYQIMAVFSTFDLEFYPDILRIGSGLDPDDTASLLATLSGSSLPDIIVSNNNEMWLVFTSDVSVTEPGFRVNFEVYTPRNYIEFFFADTCVEEFCYGGEETTVCRCDDMCQFFGDCCPDYPLPIFNETPSNETLLNETESNETPSNETLSAETISNETLSNETLSNETLSNKTLSNETLPNETLSNETVLDLDVWECIVDSFLPLFYPFLGHGYRMIARCPSGWSLEEDVKRNCEEVPPNATIDVLYIYNNIYFRNLGCATCHGYTESSLTAVVISADQQCWWGYEYTLACMTPMPALQSNVSMIISGSDIMPTVQTIPKPRLCLVNTTGSCPNGTNEEIASECQYYYKPFIIEGVVRKHPACSNCNGGPLVICQPIITDVDARNLPMYEYDEPMHNEGIIDIFIMPEPIRPLVVQCIEGFEMDDNGNCAPISSDWPVCQSKYFGVKQSNGTVECLEEMVCFREVTMDNITISAIVPPPCLVRSSTDVVNDTITFSVIYRDDMNPSLDIIQRDIIHQLQTPSRDGCKDIVISTSQSCYVEENPENITYRCPEEMFAGYYLDLTPSLINNESLIYFNGTYIRPTWWSNITNMQFSSDNVSSEYQFVMCGTEIALQTCSFFTVSNDSIEWDYQGNQSVILYQGQMYDTEDILIHPDGSISICYIDQVTPISRRTLIILGHVLFATSSVCLFATLITYVAFSTLRNRQGVSIMNFIVALFLGQIFLQYIRLLVSQLGIPCIVVAAMSHFFFLASFFWTTILAWDLSRSFAASKMKSFSSSTFGRKMVFFLVIGWGTPLVFVSITLLLQFGGFQNGPLLEYDSNTCWLAKLSSIVMFFIPMTLCLLSNLVFFII